MPASRQTEDQRRIEAVETQVRALEGQVVAMGTEQRLMGQMIANHAEKSDDFRASQREATERQEQAIARIEKGLSETQALSQQLVNDARAERDAKRSADAAEAEHRRKMELAAVASADARGNRAWEAARAVATHPTTIGLLAAITSAVGAWTYATWGEVPVRSVTPVHAVSAEP